MSSSVTPKVVRVISPLMVSSLASPGQNTPNKNAKKGTPKSQPVDYIQMFTTLPTVTLVTKSLGPKDARRIVDALKSPKGSNKELMVVR